MYNAYQIGGTYTFQLFNENDEMILSSDSIVEIVNRCIKDKVAFFAALPVKSQGKAISKIAPKASAKVIQKFDENTKAVKNKDIYLQSAAFWYVPLLIILAIACASAKLV